jgi:hypothetical protein
LQAEGGNFGLRSSARNPTNTSSANPKPLYSSLTPNRKFQQFGGGSNRRDRDDLGEGEEEENIRTSSSFQEKDNSFSETKSQNDQKKFPATFSTIGSDRNNRKLNWGFLEQSLKVQVNDDTDYSSCFNFLSFLSIFMCMSFRMKIKSTPFPSSLPNIRLPVLSN